MNPLPPSFVLKTDRLRLRMPEESDMPAIFEASQTVGFNDGMLWDPPASLDELRGPYERAVKAWREARSYQFTIELQGQLVGRIALRPTDEDGVLDIGYWTHPAWQGRGIMTEAARAIIELGFGPMEARAIIACFAVWNDPSRRLLETLGFLTERIVAGGFIKGDRVSDEAHVRLENTDWSVG